MLYWLLSPYLPSGKETIVIDARTIEAVHERRTNLAGREPTAEERAQVVDDYVGEEILLREAYRHGWHLKSSRVRQRLILAMRSAMSEALPEPSTAQLRAYYQANAERYRAPESVTFSHVFFENGAPRSPPDTSKLLESLNRGTDFRTLGDDFWLGATIRQTKTQLAGVVGRSFADEVFALEPGSWFGPIVSKRGVHLVRLLARHPETLLEFDNMEQMVRTKWITDRHAEIRERKMSRIRERYTVRRDPS